MKVFCVCYNFICSFDRVVGNVIELFNIHFESEWSWQQLFSFKRYLECEHVLCSYLGYDPIMLQ